MGQPKYAGSVTNDCSHISQFQRETVEPCCYTLPKTGTKVDIHAVSPERIA